MAQDLALFIVFFDLMLVPFYFLIGGWGTGDRVRATTKFVIYTLVGLAADAGRARSRSACSPTPDGGQISFSLADAPAPLGRRGSQEWIVLLFALAFFVKAPLFPLHGWVPETYRSHARSRCWRCCRACCRRSASTASCGSCCRSCPTAPQHWQELFIIVAVFSILYGSVLAFSQDNVRLVRRVLVDRPARLHRAGDLRASTTKGAQGAILQMLNHGLVVVPLFLIIGVIAARAGGSESLCGARRAWRSGRRCWRRCS